MMDKAKKVIDEADVILITAGAGMGVDSGLPDFRGNEGMWKEYPALKKQKIDFESIANPKQFQWRPELIWAFYGHRFDLYKKTTPNVGFDALRELVKNKKDYFIVTSNVDGQFQKAGFDTDKIYEVHGRINKFQCTSCNATPWKAPDKLPFKIDGRNFKVKGDLPMCPKCGALARPNIMMFSDFHFQGDETSEQNQRFNKFMHSYDKGPHKIAIIEIGAGTAISTIRDIGDNIHENLDNAQLIRINPREAFGPKDVISVRQGGVAALTEILPEDIKKMFFIK